jgi:acyl carrier protein
MVTIASRTPEGAPGRCPVCGKEVRIESSLIAGDAPCPHCGTLLWFVGVSYEDRLLFEYAGAEVIRERALEFLARALGVSKEELETNPAAADNLGYDSLDLVELMMELEDELNKPD